MKHLLLLSAALLLALASCAKKEEPAPETTRYTIGVILTGLPFAAKNDAGELIGIEPELLQRMAKDEKCIIDMKVIERDQMEELLTNGTVQGVIGRLVYQQNENGSPLLYTDPYLSLYQTVLIQAGAEFERLSDLEGRRVGVREGSNAEAFLADRQDIFLRRLPSNDACVEALLKGELEAVMMDNIPAEEYLAKYEGTLDELPDTFDMRNYALLSRNGEFTINWTFNSQLFRMRGIGFVAELRRKYQSYFNENFK